jgi:hypothetical protein
MCDLCVDMYKKGGVVVVVKQNVFGVQVGELFEDVRVRFAFEAKTELTFEVRFFKDDVVHKPDDDDASDHEPQEAVRRHVTYFEERVHEHKDRKGIS